MATRFGILAMTFDTNAKRRNKYMYLASCCATAQLLSQFDTAWGKQVTRVKVIYRRLQETFLD